LSFLFVFLTGFVVYKIILSKRKKQEKKKPKITSFETVNQLALEKRPYIIIEPKSKTRPQDYGYWMTTTISNASNYQFCEYEVEYQSSNLIQGFMHRFDISGKDKISQEGFFGSESKGKYKYDEGVKSGSVLLKFFKNDKDYDILKTYFNWLKVVDQDGVFISNDAKASLKIDSSDLKPTDYLVVFSTLGLPKNIKGTVLSLPYGFYSRRPTKLKSAVLTIKSKKDLTGAKILGWNGNNWHIYKTTVDKESASSKVNQLGIYILVK